MLLLDQSAHVGGQQIQQSSFGLHTWTVGVGQGLTLPAPAASHIRVYKKKGLSWLSCKTEGLHQIPTIQNKQLRAGLFLLTKTRQR